MSNPFEIAAIRALMAGSAKKALNRAAGGSRARNGLDFEDDYAASRLVEAAVDELVRRGSGDGVYLHGGVVTFVDDFYLFDGRTHILSQVKRGVISKKTFEKSIIPAFLDQLSLARKVRRKCRTRGAPVPDITIELVVSDDREAVRAKTRLAGISSRVKIYRPVDLKVGPRPGTALHDLILQLASEHRAPQPQLLLEQLSNAWYVLRRQGTLDEFVRHAAGRCHGFLQTFGPDYLLSPEVARKLSVARFEHRITGSNFYYRTDGMDQWFVSPRVLCGSSEWLDFEQGLTDDEDEISLLSKLAGL